MFIHRKVDRMVLANIFVNGISKIGISIMEPRLRQQPDPGLGRLGWLAWFKMLLGLGGGAMIFRLDAIICRKSMPHFSPRRHILIR